MSTRNDNPEPLRVRVAMIEEDLKQAELTDLATAHNADLVELVERMRSATADALRIIRRLLAEE